MEAFALEDSKEHREEWAKVMYGFSLKEQKEWQEKQEEAPENPMGPYNVGRPGGLYHQMLETIIPCGARGVLWYQGESDEGHADIYDRLFEAMIGCWRESFCQELPCFVCPAGSLRYLAGRDGRKVSGIKAQAGNGEPEGSRRLYDLCHGSGNV